MSSTDVIFCPKRKRQINKLSPSWRWGKKHTHSFDASEQMHRVAEKMEFEAEMLERYDADIMSSECQRLAILRTARQLRETATRICREADGMPWIGDDYNVVDLSQAYKAIALTPPVRRVETNGVVA